MRKLRWLSILGGAMVLATFLGCLTGAFLFSKIRVHDVKIDCFQNFVLMSMCLSHFKNSVSLGELHRTEFYE